MIAHALENTQKIVLVVEDDELCRSSVTALLESMGIAVVAVADGESAIPAFERGRKDIGAVLLDVVLPGLSGADTFRALRGLGSDIPIVLTSGYEEEAVSGEFTDLSYAGFVPKPADPKKLEELMQRLTADTSTTAGPKPRG